MPRTIVAVQKAPQVVCRVVLLLDELRLRGSACNLEANAIFRLFRLNASGNSIEQAFPSKPTTLIARKISQVVVIIATRSQWRFAWLGFVVFMNSSCGERIRWRQTPRVFVSSSTYETQMTTGNSFPLTFISKTRGNGRFLQRSAVQLES